MVSIHPRRKCQHRPRRTRLKTTSRPTKNLETERSYFFIGRQGHSPYVYDRNATPRPSNILWLFQDDLDREAHHRMYQREARSALHQEEIEVKKRCPRIVRRATGKQAEKDGDGMGGIGGIIDLTLSDDEELAGKGSEEGKIDGRVTGGSGSRVRSSGDGLGKNNEMRATFVSPFLTRRSILTCIESTV